jgi:hypothetical protein
MYPEAWEERSVALLRALPGDCRERNLVLAVLTLPLAEADALHLEAAGQTTASHSKKVKRDTVVCVCFHHMLKWPVKDREIAQALHEGNLFVCLSRLHFRHHASQACFRWTNWSSVAATFKRCLDPKSRLRSEQFPPLSVNSRRWLLSLDVFARPSTSRIWLPCGIS